MYKLLIVFIFTLGYQRHMLVKSQCMKLTQAHYDCFSYDANRNDAFYSIILGEHGPSFIFAMDLFQEFYRIFDTCPRENARCACFRSSLSEEVINYNVFFNATYFDDMVRIASDVKNNYTLRCFKHLIH